MNSESKTETPRLLVNEFGGSMPRANMWKNTISWKVHMEF